MMRAMTMQPPHDVPILYPACPSCGGALRFARTVPETEGLAELQTFSCRECSLWITESADEHPRRTRPKARNSFSSASSQLSLSARLPALGVLFARRLRSPLTPIFESLFLFALPLT